VRLVVVFLETHQARRLAAVVPGHLLSRHWWWKQARTPYLLQLAGSAWQAQRYPARRRRLLGSLRQAEAEAGGDGIPQVAAAGAAVALAIRELVAPGIQDLTEGREQGHGSLVLEVAALAVMEGVRQAYLAAAAE
jgi:hypothetical protein